MFIISAGLVTTSVQNEQRMGDEVIDGFLDNAI
jgi:hypothetical protein